MADFRIRGYMVYAGQVGAPPASCADSWIVACGKQGPWLLRAASGALKIEGPSTGFAPFKTTLINCPEAITSVTADSNGNNAEAQGTFPADATTPLLVPATAFLMAGGGNPSSLLLRTVGGAQCIYEFTVRAWAGRASCRVGRAGLMQPGGRRPAPTNRARSSPLPPTRSPPPAPQLTEATSYVLGVQPVKWVSWYHSAAGRSAGLSTSLLLAAALAAVAAVRALR